MSASRYLTQALSHTGMSRQTAARHPQFGGYGFMGNQFTITGHLLNSHFNLF